MHGISGWEEGVVTLSLDRDSDGQLTPCKSPIPRPGYWPHKNVDFVKSN